MKPSEILKAALAALTLSTTFACSPRGGAGNEAPTKRGGEPAARELFARNCATCHGPVGEGKQVGTLVVPTLREGRAAQDTDARLLSQIHDGGKGMPPFKWTLTDDEIQALLHFVREDLQGKKQ